MLSDVAIIIPTRIGSTRLPRKALKKIGDLTMIEHVYKKALQTGLQDVYVATDDQEIADVIDKMGGKSIITPSDCPSGTDRVFAALQTIKHKDDIKYVVNLQGDQPFVDPKIIKDLITTLKNSDADIATPVSKIDHIAANDISKVKVVLSKNDFALYFSRSMIPHNAQEYWYHVGIYAFTKNALAKFVALPESTLERSESLEQLRALENGMKIIASYTNSIPISVDTERDLEVARKMYLAMNL